MTSESDCSARETRKALAQRLFSGVYGGDPAVVDELAANNTVASYPVFQTIFGAPAIRGIDAYRRHTANFHAHWKDCETTFHRVLADGHTVVLLWSFQGTRVDAADTNHTPAPVRWGGITFIEFDDHGKVVSEFGEESQPGPVARLASVSP